MPRPVGNNFFDQVNFVTNYLLAGCGPEQDLIVELNTDAALNLFCILVTPDIQDIVQGFFSPKQGRNTKPNRHGRKRKGGIRFPDISDEIGKGLGGGRPAHLMNKIPGGRYILPGINFVEGIAITALIVEGVGDIVFDNLLGILELNPDHCKQFPRASRTMTTTPIMGGPILEPDGFNCDKVDFASGFQTTQQGARHSSVDWAISGAALITGEVSGFPASGWPIIYGLNGKVWHQEPKRTVKKGEFISITGSAAIPAGEWAFWGWLSEQNYLTALSANWRAWGKSGWLDWTDYVEVSL